MKISFIVAAAENGVIGRDNKMPWSISSDLKQFRKLTMGKPLIMGRKTFHSIGSPLDGRDNIILTRDKNFHYDDIFTANTIDEAISIAKSCATKRGVAEIMVIGGAEIYTQLLDHADQIYMTLVHDEPEGDAYFPKINRDEWQEVSRKFQQAGPKDSHNFSIIAYKRVQASK